MKFSLLTYNLMLNKAAETIKELIHTYKPDLISLQEIGTDDKNLKVIQNLGYRLADYSNSFIRRNAVYGVTTFYNSSVFTMKKSNSFNLPTNLYQIITFILHGNRNPRTVLKNEFIHKKTKKELTLYNIHLSPFATNQLRTRQIKNTFGDMALNEKKAVIIAGDFNFPYGRKRFEDLIVEHKLKEATSNINFTLEKKILKSITIKLKLDYVLYKNIKLVSNTKINDFNKSDHFPILSTFSV
ncbi:MAG: endonuclease/exonuclease/phosphatase family protein [Patescibacteria group bacterium]